MIAMNIFIISLVAFCSTVAGMETFGHKTRISVKKYCSMGIYENDPLNDEYTTLKENVEKGIRSIYRNNANFYSAAIEKIYCKDDMKDLQVEVEIKWRVDVPLANVMKNLIDEISDGYLNNTAIETGTALVTNSASYYAHNPGVHAVLKTNIFTHHFCDLRYDFKKLLAAKIISSDGLTVQTGNQIFFSYHQCNDKDARFKKAVVHFYVSAKGKGTADYSLTNLAYKIVDQTIFDGSTWKLGLGLHHAVDKIDLVKDGNVVTDSDLSDLEIIYIGVGSVAGLLLLIIIFILIINCCCRCCCDNDDDDDDDYEATYHETKKQYEMEVISGVANDKSVEEGYTNQTYEDEKSHDAPGTNAPEVGYEFLQLQIPPPPPSYEEEEPVQVEYDVPVESTPYIPVYINDEQEDFSEQKAYDASSFDDSDDSDVEDGDDLYYNDVVNKRNDHLAIENEFTSLERRMPTALIYPSEIAAKNRRPDVFPWPECRVVLSSHENDPTSDYINASFVKDLKGKNAFIATQGPLQSTVNDFWKMIWEQQAKVIVMATPLSSRGLELCYQYWPADSIAREYGNGMVIQLKKKELKPDFVATTVTLKCGDEVRDVQIFRYMSWPQNGGVPDVAKSVVVFLLEVIDATDHHNGDNKTVFHCSDGIGMTGAFIAITEGMVMLEEQQKVNVKKIVRVLRNNLAGAVETAEQYQFVYEALYQYTLYLQSSV